MYNTFWWHALFVRGQQFSVKTFDRSRNSCQEIRLGWEMIFGAFRAGAPSPLTCLPHARPFFLAPTTSKRLLRRLGHWVQDLLVLENQSARFLKMPLEECKVLAIHFFLLKNNLTTCQSGQYKSANIFPPALPSSFHRMILLSI